MVAVEKYAELLKKYLAGAIALKQLRESIEERLFALRETFGEVSEEEDFLSGIELFIEEVKDGFRSIDDLKTYLESLVQASPYIFVIIDAKECRETRQTVFAGASNTKFTASIISPEYKPTVTYHFQAQFV